MFVRKWVTPKIIAVIVIVALAIPIGWYLAAPLATNANAPPPSGFSQLVKQGAFQGADSFHFASGVAKILSDGQGNYVLRVEDFSVRNGPDIEYFLSADSAYDTTDAGLGNVGATTGSYNVAIPAGTDVSRINYVIIWCVPFSVLFATAALA